MRIAYVTETFLPSIDGVVTRMTHALDWLGPHGDDVTIIGPDLGCEHYRDFRFVGIRSVRYPVYPTRPWGTPSPRVARELARISPDVIHVWQPALIGLPAVIHARTHGVPLVTSFHTDVARYAELYGHSDVLRRIVWAYVRPLMRAGDIRLATSHAASSLLASQGIGGIRVLPRGVDLSSRNPRFASREMRVRLGCTSDDQPLLLFVGRVAPEKSIETLEPMMRRHPEWHLAIVGDGPSREHLQGLFRGTGTTFTGFLTGEELSSAYASADAFVFPSRSETLGLVLLEAMASGTPVVAASSPATDEQIVTGSNGIVYHPDLQGELEAAVMRTLYDAPLRSAVISNGLAEAREHGWDAAGAALYEAYRDACHPSARDSRARR